MHLACAYNLCRMMLPCRIPTHLLNVLGLYLIPDNSFLFGLLRILEDGLTFMFFWFYRNRIGLTFDVFLIAVIILFI